MLLTKLFSGSQKPDDSYWKNISIQVAASSQDPKHGKRVLFPECFAYFKKENEKDEKINLILDSRKKNEDFFSFPVLATWQPTVEVTKNSVIFEINISSDLAIFLSVSAVDEDYDDSSEFRAALAKLIYEAQNKKSYTTCKNFDEEIKRIVKLKGNTDQPKQDLEEIRKLADKIMKDPLVTFCSIGKFSSITLPNQDKINSILDESILKIERRSNFSSALVIVDKAMKDKYQKIINQELNFFIDKAKNSISWIDQTSGNLSLFNFSAFTGSIGDLENIMAKSVYEASKQMPLEEAIKKEGNNWDQYYLQDEPNEREIEEEFARYQRTMQRAEYSEKHKVVNAPEPTEAVGFKNMVQAKSLGLCLANRGEGIEIFKFKRDDYHNNLEHSETLRGIKSKDGENIIASKLLLQEGDSKLMMTDERNPKSLIYTDLLKGKIVSEWKPTNDHIKDIALNAGKSQAFSHDPLILALSKQSIVRVDPRTPKGVVTEHNYKTNYFFEKLMGVGDKATVVSSANGDLRFYSDIEGIAKNVVPSKFGEGAVSIDHSQDGSLLLLAYPKTIVLMPTGTKEGSAFVKVFRKDRKPGVITLSISPHAMLRNGISNLNFISAKFDEKAKESESYVVAVTGEHIVLWLLSDVAKNKYATSLVKKMDNTMVAGEFMYNQDDLLAAFRKNLTIQELRTDRI